MSLQSYLLVLLGAEGGPLYLLMHFHVTFMLAIAHLVWPRSANGPRLILSTLDWDLVLGGGGAEGPSDGDRVTLIVSQPRPWLLALTFLQNCPEHPASGTFLLLSPFAVPSPATFSKSSHVSGAATKGFMEPCVFWSIAKHLWLQGQ